MPKSPVKKQSKKILKTFLPATEEAKRSLAIADRIIKAYKPPLWKRERIGHNSEEIIKIILKELPTPALRLQALIRAREDLHIKVRDKPEGVWIMSQAEKAYNAIKDKMNPVEWYELSKETCDIHKDALRYDAAIEEQKRLIEYERNFETGKKIDKKNFTSSITAARLAKALNISNATISNFNRPLGKYFQICCKKQNTKSPRLNLDDLLPLAQESMRRSRKKNLDEVEDACSGPQKLDRYLR